MRDLTAIVGLLLALLVAPCASPARGESDHPVEAPKPPIRPVVEHSPLVSAETTWWVSVEPQRVRTRARMEYRVVRGATDCVRFALPADQRLVGAAVNGATAGNPVMTSEGDLQVATLRLPARTDGVIVLEARCEKALPETSLDLGGESGDQFVHPIDVVWSRGLLVVSHAPGRTVLVERLHGLTQIADCEVPEEAKRPDARYFRAYGTNLRLEGSVIAVEPRIRVDQQAKYATGDGELRLASRLMYDVSRAEVFELALQWPDGLALERAEAEGLRDVHVDESGVLRLGFRRAQRGTVEVRLAGRAGWRLEPGEQALPLVRPLGTESSTGTIAVSAPASFRVSVVDAAQRDVSSYRRRPEQVVLRVVRPQASLSAQSSTQVTVNRERAEVETLLDYSVSGAALTTFGVAVPESIADRMEIETVGGDARILERTSSPGERPGWMSLALVMSRPVIGALRLRARWELLLEDAEGETSRLVVQPVRVLVPENPESAEPPAVLKESAGAIVLRGDRSLRLTAQTHGAEPIPVPAGMAWRHGSELVELVVNVADARRAELVSTFIIEGSVEVALSPAGPAEYDCRYRLTSEPRRLPVQLPAGSELLSATHGSRTVGLERLANGEHGYETFEVNLPGSAGGGAPQPLTLRFRAPLESSLAKRRGLVVVPLPILGEAGDPTIAVGRLQTSIRLPEELVIVGGAAGFSRLGDGAPRPVEGLTGESTLEYGGNVHHFRSEGFQEQIELDYWDGRFAAWLLSGAALLVAWVLRPTSWENRIGMLLLAGAAASLIALPHPGAAAAALSAARWGLAAGASVWIIDALRRRPWAAARTAEAPSIAVVIAPATSSGSGLRELRKGA